MTTTREITVQKDSSTLEFFRREAKDSGSSFEFINLTEGFIRMMTTTVVRRLLVLITTLNGDFYKIVKSMS